MARIDSYEITTDDRGAATFELFHGEGEAKERVCETRIRDVAVARLWLELLQAPGELEYDEGFESLRLKGGRGKPSGG
jgi:hypothetical protein